MQFQVESLGNHFALMRVNQVSFIYYFVQAMLITINIIIHYIRIIVKYELRI